MRYRDGRRVPSTNGRGRQAFYFSDQLDADALGLLDGHVNAVTGSSDDQSVSLSLFELGGRLQLLR